MNQQPDPSETATQTVSIRRLLGDTVIYGLGDVADRAIGMVLLPVIAALLTPADYGVCGLFATSSYVLLLFFSMGTPTGFFRFYTEEDDPRRRGQLLDGAVGIITVFSVALGLLLLLLARPINRLLCGTEGVELVYLLVYMTYVRSLNALGSCRLQADGRAWTYVTAKLMQAVVGRGLGLLLILSGWRFWGLLIGIAVGETLAGVILALAALADVRLCFHRESYRKVLSYGVSLIPAALSYWVMIGQRCVRDPLAVV